jgi:ubiquinone/menaquinone biosynthesis C-methylase UbiE
MRVAMTDYYKLRKRYEDAHIRRTARIMEIVEKGQIPLDQINKFKIFRNCYPNSLKSQTIIDIGSGEAGGALQHALQHANVFMVDISKTALKTAVKVTKAFGVSRNCQVIVGEAHFLPIRNATADIVYLADVLEHLSDPQLCLKEIHRVCKRDKYLFIVVPNFLNVFNIIGDFAGFIYNKMKRQIPQHLNHFTKNGLIKLVSCSGFTLVQIKLESYDSLTMRLRSIVAADRVHLLAMKRST